MKFQVSYLGPVDIIANENANDPSLDYTKSWSWYYIRAQEELQVL